MTASTLTGRAFDLDLGPFVPRLSFLSDRQARLQATIGPTVVDEVIDVEVTAIRPDVYVMSWVEKSGNFIVQLQDHENGVVHNRARLADGQVFNATGTIRPVGAG